MSPDAAYSAPPCSVDPLFSFAVRPLCRQPALKHCQSLFFWAFLRQALLAHSKLQLQTLPLFIGLAAALSHRTSQCPRAPPTAAEEAKLWLCTTSTVLLRGLLLCTTSSVLSRGFFCRGEAEPAAEWRGHTSVSRERAAAVPDGALSARHGGAGADQHAGACKPQVGLFWGDVYSAGAADPVGT